MLKKIISVVLILSFALAFAGELAQSPGYDMGYMHGKRDGKRDASWLWIFAGTACNCLGAAVAYFVPGDVPSEMIVGQAPDYSKGYADAYIRAKRWRQVMWASIGILINSAVVGTGAASLPS